MECRPGCGACCIAPSISTPLPATGQAKAAGVPCPHLLPDLRCGIFGRPERPAVCAALKASADMCGTNREEALVILTRLEHLTRPDS